MYFADSRKESFASWSCHHKKLSIHLSVTLTKEFVPYWLNLAGGTMKRQCVHFRDYTYSAAKLPSWLESVLIIVTVFSGDQVIESRQDQPEWLWRASCRAAYELQELKKKKKNHWSQTFILFPSWVVFWLWLDAHNLMRGLPPVCGCICKPETVSVWYLDSTWLHLQKLSHLRHIVASYRILHR